MKKQLCALFAGAIFIHAVFAPAFCIPYCSSGTCMNYTWNNDKQTFNCTGRSCTCNTTTYVCASGGLELVCFFDSDCGTGYVCTDNVCVACSGCTDCNNVSWASYSTGYQRQTTATCNCNTCTKTYAYRCAPGYYGSSTNGTSGCTRCPTENNLTGQSAAGASAVTGCYIPSGTSFSDSYGSGIYAGNSYWCN